MTGRFGSVITAMVTPFDADGALDLDGAVSLARWLVDEGNEGLVLAGSTGEGSSLTDAEKLELFRAVSEAVTVPCIGATGGADTTHTVELSRQASDTGLAALLVVTPYYNRPSQSGIEAHFRAVAGATDLPVVIYDIPVRTGRKVTTPVLLRLAEDVANIVGVKDAAGSPAESARLLAAAPDGFELLSGEDALTLPLLAVGAVGVIGVATHWTAKRHVEMVTAFRSGDVATARAVNAALLESFAFETSEAAPNPIPTKTMLRVLGHDVGECRLPLGPAPAGLEERARAVYANLA